MRYSHFLGSSTERITLYNRKGVETLIQKRVSCFCNDNFIVMNAFNVYPPRKSLIFWQYLKHNGLLSVKTYSFTEMPLKWTTVPMNHKVESSSLIHRQNMDGSLSVWITNVHTQTAVRWRDSANKPLWVIPFYYNVNVK